MDEKGQKGRPRGGLTARQRRILQAIVQSHVQTAEPVGSSYLAQRYGFPFSPATIRNEMAELEDYGLLQQPHTSAGRVPSDAGYRVYVDELMEPIQFLAPDEARIQQRYADLPADLEEILHQTARVLAGSAGCTAAVSPARLSAARIRSIQVIPVDIQQGLLVVLSDSGITNHHLLRLPRPMAAEELHQVNLYLKTHLRGATFRAQLPIPPDARPRVAAVLQQVAAQLRHSSEEEERVYVMGINNTLQQPEFTDTERIRAFMSLLESTHVLASWLNTRLDDDIQISIGHENPHPQMTHCSMVSAVYRIAGQPAGTIALLGPTRMDYPRAVAALEVVAKYLSTLLDRYFG